MIQLETPRLLLRPFVPEDLAALRQTLGDPQVMYAWEHGFSDEEVAGWISRNRRRYAQEGMGYLAAVERQTGELVGSIGLAREQLPGEVAVCLGYILRRDRWGRGLAREGAAACLGYAFRELGEPQVAADIRPENLASIRVAQALGMEPEGLFDKWYRGRPLPHRIYRLTAAAYQARQRKEGTFDENF